jgi:hypothetical protein
VNIQGLVRLEKQILGDVSSVVENLGGGNWKIDRNDVIIEVRFEQPF